jgi:hypothetical protein
MPGPELNGELNVAEKDADVASENRDIRQVRAPEALKRRTEEIQEYLRARQAARRVVTTTRTQQGQELDWIDVASQAPGGRVAEPPSEDSESNPYAQNSPDDYSRWTHSHAQFELERDPTARGPQGTVPIVRRSLRVRPTGTLQEFLSKHGRPTFLMRLNDDVEIPMPSDNSKHVYAYSNQSVTCYGGEGNINVWSPYIQWSDEMTLGQIAVSRGAGWGFQTVEAGWQRLPNLYGDWKVHLFVFYTTNGYLSSGDKLGGYNQDVDGWVQVSPTIFPEALMSVSSYLGPQAYINVKVQLSNGNWWVRVKGTWIGYYPATLFQFFGLQSQASSLAWFGEVADSSNHPGTTSTDMGSGHFPWEGYQKAAYMNQLAVQTSPAGTLTKYSPQTVYATNSACYGMVGNFQNTGSWGPYFYWGGTGKNGWCV